MARVLTGRRGRVTLCVAAVVGLVVGVSVLVATGSREPAAALRLLNGDAWLANARTGTASHVNGYTGKVDGQAAIGAAGDPFQIVERPDGAYALDLRTGRLVRLDSATLTAGTSAGPRAPGPTSGLQVVTATNATWVIDTTSGIVQQVNPDTLAAIGPQIPLGAPTGRATSDNTSTLWVPVPARGGVEAITTTGQLTAHPVGHPGDQVQVADTSTGVWAVDATAGRAQSLSAPGAHPVSFPPLTAHTPLVGADPSAPYVVVVANLTAAARTDAVRSTSQVLVINTTRSSLSSVTSPAAAPATQVVVSGNQAYLLDAASHQLQTVNLARTDFQPPITVPPGSNQLIAKDQLVFVNATNSPQALVVNATGQATPITKYTPTPPTRTRPGPPQKGHQQGFNPGPGPHSVTPLVVPGPPDHVLPTPAPPPLGPRPRLPIRPPAPPPTHPPVNPPRPPPPTTRPTTRPTARRPTATTQPPSVPSAPTITGVTPGFERVTVTWTPPKVSGGSGVQHYTLTAGSSSVEIPGTATSGVLPVAADGTKVCPTISASNSTGTSPATGGTICARTSNLGQVTGLSVKTSGTSVTASWNAVAHAIGYKVSVSSGSSATVSSTSYTFTGSQWTQYSVTVAAFDKAATGPSSPAGVADTTGTAVTQHECLYTSDGAIGTTGGSDCGKSQLWVWTGVVAPFSAFPGPSSIADHELCAGWITSAGSNNYLVEPAGTSCPPLFPPQKPAPAVKMWVSIVSHPGLTQVCVYQGWTTDSRGGNAHHSYGLWPPDDINDAHMTTPTQDECFYTPQ